MYKIKDIAKILNVSDRTVERKFPRFLEKVFSAAQKTFSKNEDSEAIIKMEIIPKILLMRAVSTHILKS